MKSGQESPAGEKGSMIEAVKMSSEFLNGSRYSNGKQPISCQISAEKRNC